MKCTNCGAETDKSVCEYCGKRLKKESLGSKIKNLIKTKKFKRLAIIIPIAVALLILILFYPIQGS